MNFHNKTKRIKDKTASISQSWMLKMVTSYSIFLLVILFLFTFVYQISMNQIHDSFLSQYETAIIGDVNMFEQDYDIMDTYCKQLLQNKDFRKLYSMTNVDEAFISLASSVHTSLSVDVLSESLLPIKEVFFYLPNSNYIVSANTFTSAERYYKWSRQFDINSYEKWLEVLSVDENYYKFVSLDEYYPNHTHQYFMYIINLDDLYFRDANAICCFIFDEEDLLSTFSSLSSDPNSFLVVENEQSIPVLALNTANLYTKNLNSLDFNKGYEKIEIEQASINIRKYISDTKGFTYYYSIPEFYSTGNIILRQFMYVSIFLSLFVVGIIIIYYFSRRNVKPIIELGEELQVAVDTNSHLQEVVDQQRPIICNSYLRQLFAGTITSNEEADYIKQYLNIENSIFLNSLYICVYNNTNEIDTTIESNYSPEEFDSIIANALQELIGKQLFYFSPNVRTYAVLLNTDELSEADFTFKIHQTIVKLHNYLLDTYGIWLFAGIGKSTNDIMNVWECYQQAIEAVSYASKNYFFFPYEFIKKDSNAFYYPPELSTKLIHFITTGNIAQTMELFSLIHQENIEERSLPINILKFLLSDIRNTLLKAKFALPSNTPKEAIDKLDEQFNQHVTFKLCEDIALNLCKLFGSETEDSNLITTIEEYIKKNYSDPSLGLNKISDEFQISESYFSHMFKEKTGINFSSYLENLRMAEAARLIQETNISLNELYISVGYNNATSFRRAFKKIYGITPSSMRPNTKDDK